MKRQGKCQAWDEYFDYTDDGVGNASNGKCFRRGISNLEKNGRKHHLKDSKMKFSALSVAAVLAFFAQTMAEPLPQTSPPTCTTTSFECRSSINMHWFLTDFRRWWSMCKLIIRCEVAVKLDIEPRWVFFRNYNVSIHFKIKWPTDWRVIFFLRPIRMDVLWTCFPGNYWTVGFLYFKQHLDWSFDAI